MDAKTLLSTIVRAQVQLNKKESLEAMKLLTTALQESGKLASVPVEIKAKLRDSLQTLAKDPLFLEYCPKGISYTPGKEAALGAGMQKVVDVIVKKLSTESKEQTRARKMQLDIHYNEGLRLLGRGEASEADEQFAQAISFCKDEFSLYALIGKALMDAGEVRRSLPYFKKGLDASPDDAKMKELCAKAIEMRNALESS